MSDQQRAKWDKLNREQKKFRSDYLEELRFAGNRHRKCATWTGLSPKISQRAARKKLLVSEFVTGLESCVFICGRLSLHFKGTYKEFLEVHRLDDTPRNCQRFFTLQGRVRKDVVEYRAALRAAEYVTELDSLGEIVESLSFTPPRTSCQIYHPKWGRLPTSQ